MNYQKIVVGIDFSPGSDEALAQGLMMAQRTGAELILAHVTPAFDYPAHLVAAATDENAISELRKAYSQHIAEERNKLQEIRDGIARSGKSVSQVIADGYPDTGLLKIAQEMRADLLVVGADGRTRLERFILGSVSQQVVRLAECDVLVARPKDGKSITRFREVLVAVDFGEHSQRALAKAVKLADKDGLVHALHCLQYPVPFALGYAPFEGRMTFSAQLAADLERDAHKQFESWTQTLPAGNCALSFYTVRSAPALGICDRANGYDLIVVGSHGRRGVRRFILGSVAETVVRHAPCSTLIVR
jgi:nucleotide-binding universal stress UspA family protein